MRPRFGQGRAKTAQRGARRYPAHQCRQAIAIGLEPGDGGFKPGIVACANSAARTVFEQSLDKAGRRVGAFAQAVRQAQQADLGLAIESARGVNGGIMLVRSERADTVVVFQRQADRIGQGMATGTGRALAAARLACLSTRRSDALASLGAVVRLGHG